MSQASQTKDVRNPEQAGCGGEGCCKGEGGGKAEGCCGGESKGKSGGGCCKGEGKLRGVLGNMAENLAKPMTAEEMAELPTLHLVMRARKGIEQLDQRVFQLTEQQIDQAFLPEAGVGRWPVRVLIGHLADAEIAAVHRMRRIVGEDSPVVNAWDEDAFVDANLYQNGEKQYADSPDGDRSRVMNALGGYMAVIHTLRQWTCQWLLSLDDAAWDRAMMHPARGAVTLKKYVALNTWHVEHHAKFLKAKLDKMGIVLEEEEASGGGGCGSGCGCH